MSFVLILTAPRSPSYAYIRKSPSTGNVRRHVGYRRATRSQVGKVSKDKPCTVTILLTNGVRPGLDPHLPSIPLKTLHASHSIPSRSQQWRTVSTRSIASVLVTRPRLWAKLLLYSVSFRKTLTHSLKPWVIFLLKHPCAWTDHRWSKPWWGARMPNTTRTSRRWLILLMRVRPYDHFIVFFPSYWMLSVGCLS